MSQKSVKQNVCYVKLSPIYLEYLKIKYQSCPVQFSSVEEIGRCIERYIVNNPALKPITSFSYCEQAYEQAVAGNGTHSEPMIPLHEELPMLLPVVLPASVFRFGGSVSTSSTWQLTKEGAVEFRRLVKVAFWADCFKFIDECFTRARINGERVTREGAIADFMIAYNIPMSEHPNMVRYDKRERVKMMRDIENKRDEMERKSSQPFFYT